MGIGMGKMLGFDFPANFNYPYISASITEFWRRWHMTLSGWFREYVDLYKRQDQGAAGQGTRRFGVRALPQKQLAQPCLLYTSRCV